jgi:hypothetical protein
MGKNSTSRIVPMTISLFIALCILVALIFLIPKKPPAPPRPTVQTNGGTILVYQIDAEGLAPQDKEDLADKMIKVLQKRIDPDTLKNLTWRPLGDTTFEVQIPLLDKKIRDKRDRYTRAVTALHDAAIDLAPALYAVSQPRDRRETLLNELAAGSGEKRSVLNDFAAAFDEYQPYMLMIDGPDDLRRLLSALGILEFRVLPTHGHPQVDMDVVARCLEDLREKGPERAGDARYVWCPIRDFQQWTVGDSLAENARLAIQDAEGRPPIVAKFADTFYVLAGNRPAEAMLCEPARTGWRVKQARVTADAMGRKAIGFTLDKAGAKLFGSLTGGNINRPLCILLDGLAVSAPVVQSRISGEGVITGRFTDDEVTGMANIINAGSLPAKLIDEPVSVRRIDPPGGPRDADSGTVKTD